MNQHDQYMRRAIELALAAEIEGEVPVGAIVVHNDKVIAQAHNLKERLQDPTAHAEILAIKQASQALGRWRLNECSLYVTLEPCPMCAGALVQSRLGRLFYGTKDPKSGAVHSLYQILTDPKLNHRVEVIGGVLQDSCANILTQFFRGKRSKPVVNDPEQNHPKPN